MTGPIIDQLPRITPTPPPIGTCSTCRFWLSLDITAPGRCHYNAPGMDFTRVIQQPTVWPMTNPDDWCGQFVARA